MYKFNDDDFQVYLWKRSKEQNKNQGAPEDPQVIADRLERL